jgi:hypothetical protein
MSLAGGVPLYVGSGVGVIRQLDVGVAVGVGVKVDVGVAVGGHVAVAVGVRVGEGVAEATPSVACTCPTITYPVAPKITASSKMPNQRR